MKTPEPPIAKIARIAVAAALTLGAAAIAGCAAQTHGARGPALMPRTLAEVRAAAPDRAASQPRPTVALVLGGGGLRGFAHVGVLRALEDAGIRPDLVVGTSAGAVVGAAYASGLSAAQVEAAARDVKLASLADWTLGSTGFIRGDAIARWIDTVTGGTPIERFPIRFAAVATDLGGQRAVVLDSGAAGRAVQASAAVPGVSVPVAYAGGHLVDGGATSLVPVAAARAMGADIVIAVDIYCSESPAVGVNVPAVVSLVMRAQSCRIAQDEKAAADVLIAPSIGTLKLSEKAQHERAIEVGYTAARQALSTFASIRNAPHGVPTPHAVTAAR